MSLPITFKLKSDYARAVLSFTREVDNLELNKNYQRYMVSNNIQCLQDLYKFNELRDGKLYYAVIAFVPNQKIHRNIKKQITAYKQRIERLRYS